MANWFECKVRYDKTTDTDAVKKVIEPYLVDALSFTEAETRITEEMKAYVSGDFEVSDIKRARYSETFDDRHSPYWYAAKLVFTTMDEKTGAEKRTSSRILVRASDIKSALANVEQGMQGTIADWMIASLQELPIIDAFYYAAPVKEEE